MKQVAKLVSFIVDGEIVGKGRPRFSFKTKRAYTPKKTEAYEKMVRKEYLNNSNVNFNDDLLRVEVIAYFAIPKSWTKKKRKGIKWKKEKN